MRGMDEVRERLIARLKDLGLSWKKVSTDLGKNPAYIQQYIKRGTPRLFPEPVRVKLSRITGLTEVQLGKPSNETDEGHIPSAQIATGQRGARLPPYDPALMPRYGVAEGGDGSLALTGEVIDYVARPGILMGVRGAYALYVVGESMEPAFRRGDTVLINPTIPARPDDDVILSQGEPGTETTALIKHLVRVRPKDWEVEQFNPKKTLILSKAVWRFCHKVVTRYPR